MEEITLRVKLNAKYYDIGGYLIYVFENFEYTNTRDKYIMCVQFPNWNQADIDIGDVGYVRYRQVEGGVSQWYDGEKMHVYKHTNDVFLKFVKEPEKVDKEFLID